MAEASEGQGGIGLEKSATLQRGPDFGSCLG